jgi:STE24 endopeptidase
MLPGLPFDWWGQFRLEQRFGFTATQRLWWLDRLKGLVLAALLGYPLLVLVVRLFGWMGDRWWPWAWGVMMGF